VQVENGLRRAARLFDGILSSLPAITWSVDADGTILEARGGGLRTNGLHESEVLGRNFQELCPRAADDLRKALDGGFANFEWEVQHAGRTCHFDGYFQFDTERGCGAIGFSVSAPDRIDRAAGGNGHAHGLGSGAVAFPGREVTERRSLERRILTISDAERRRIGADLHDGLGQQLTGLACLATAMRDRLKKSHPKEGEKADLIAQIANEVTIQARAIARGLCPMQLEQGGLVSALEELARQSQLLLGISCEFRTKGAAPRCDQLSAIHLYRFTQEAINNAVRHGGARHLRVALVTRGSRHRLIISDDGRGFDATVHKAAPGSGLRLMNYRANEIGAEFLVTSRPGKGARVTCSFASTPNEKDFRNQGENAHDPAETPDPAGR
jgi:signal transduction histidine kinase